MSAVLLLLQPAVCYVTFNGRLFSLLFGMYLISKNDFKKIRTKNFIPYLGICYVVILKRNSISFAKRCYVIFYSNGALVRFRIKNVSKRAPFSNEGPAIVSTYVHTLDLRVEMTLICVFFHLIL